MVYYKDNISWLCDQRNITLAEFEDQIAIPKVRIMDPSPVELVKVADFFGYDLDAIVRKDLKLKKQADAMNIKLVILDVDGTMTDGGMYYTENGDQIKKFNAKDGLAIRRKAKEGIIFGIISHAFKSEAIHTRANLLNIQKVHVGQEKKSDILNTWCSELNIKPEQVAYVGDDINDIDIMEVVGLSVCPADAVKDIKRIAHIILQRNGGQACVREFIDEWLS
ncbi:MAG: HAD-IIIA family hydrolase [Crocinitomicaceae bacterium]|nr:HAD-IIIA family hydrolase [Crocinitomicaceae bacterium]MBK8925890.1 HAD-IIIA family hydrolase [Crocinitomicaceae bacterium]